MINLKNVLGEETILIGNREVSLLELFNIEEETVSQDMMQQASIYARIGMLKVRYESNRNIAKQDKESMYASLDLAYRRHYESNRAKFTEAEIKANVLADQQYIDAQQNYNNVEEMYSLFELLTRALEMRANMLQSVGAFLRMENSMTGMNTKQYESTLSTLRNKVK